MLQKSESESEHISEEGEEEIPDWVDDGPIENQFFLCLLFTDQVLCD